MERKRPFNVRLRDVDGEEHTRLIYAANKEAAAERAIERARMAKNKVLDRYGRWVVLSCEPTTQRRR